MQPVWKIMKASLAELIDTQNNLMKAITEVEDQIALQSFFARAQRLKARK